ncbi:transposase [Mycolicibacterium sarraceniae]|uniref:IS5 family transposase n=1 Tax=Mycolicibacterium sarraceniae TaxID=1534348 RepID=A0A7I7T0X6_9MYCO|nr:hypothetical protein MSAR_48620 [Mycolicibacterium sarraceniae]
MAAAEEAGIIDWAVIPEPSDQIANRVRRGSRGGDPPAWDAEDYKGRNVVERNINLVKQWRAPATHYHTLATAYRAAAVLRAITIRLPYLSGHTLGRQWAADVVGRHDPIAVQ